ncbi:MULTISPECIES: hypothetical protein [Helicobacter]|uniref:hypothetical protein n=1 Tax=Helicobacter TaxID=209 RepID=UPI000EACD494|nr:MULTISPECIES: hypothetical protein [Helicobacter]
MSKEAQESKQESHFTESVAFERLVRNSLFTLMFFLLAILSVRFLVWDNLEKFRSQHGDEVQKLMIMAHKQKAFFETFANYQAYKHSIASKLAHPSYQDSINTLNQLLKQHFTQVQIQAGTEDKHSQADIIHEIFYIKAHAHSLDDLYTFLKNMLNISNYAQVALPISITKQKHDLALEFRIHIEYRVTEF